MKCLYRLSGVISALRVPPAETQIDGLPPTPSATTTTTTTTTTATTATTTTTNTLGDFQNLWMTRRPEILFASKSDSYSRDTPRFE